MMIVIAVSAMMMGLLRLAAPLFFLTPDYDRSSFLFVLAIAGIPCLFAVCDSFIQGDSGDSREAIVPFRRLEPNRSREPERV